MEHNAREVGQGLADVFQFHIMFQFHVDGFTVAPVDRDPDGGRGDPQFRIGEDFLGLVDHLHFFLGV